MKEKIDKFIKYFTTITKEEADYIESCLEEFKKNSLKIQFNELLIKRNLVLVYLQEFESSSLAKKIVEAFKLDDYILYQNTLNELEEFYLEKGQLNEFENLRLILSNVFPILIDDILKKKFNTFALHLSKINTNPIKYL